MKSPITHDDTFDKAVEVSCKKGMDHLSGLKIAAGFQYNDRLKFRALLALDRYGIPLKALTEPFLHRVEIACREVLRQALLADNKNPFRPLICVLIGDPVLDPKRNPGFADLLCVRKRKLFEQKYKDSQ